jgi:hypothetical protein
MEWWSSSSGTIELQMSLDDAESASHQGQCLDDVKALAQMPHIKAQLDSLDPSDVAKELKGYGAWDDEELADHDENVLRLLWIAAGEIGQFYYTKCNT